MRKPIEPESRTCPVCGSTFEVGGRGRPPRRQVYCSRHCMGVATVGHLPAERGSHAPRPKKNRDTLHNEAWLRARYIDAQQSSGEIATELGVATQSVLWALRKFGIPIRSISEAKTGRPNNTEWTPDMREAMAAKRRGAANPFHGRVSPHRGPNHHDDPRIARIRHKRSTKYGLTGEAYDAMVEAQGGLCLTCGRLERKVRRNGTVFTLSVDHCHSCGAIRGLLCNDCNAALGMVAENIDTLRALVAYVENHKH